MKIGDKVRFDGNLAIGACTGIVVKIYPSYRYSDEDGEYIVPENCTVKVDAIPAKWPYVGRDVFAPRSRDLHKQ